MSPAVTAPPLLFGVDAVAVARAQELWTTFGAALARRVATDAEAAWAGAAPERYAALLAVKESAIKCLAGRPPGFRWQCVQLDPHDVPTSDLLPDVAGETLAAFAGGVRLAGERDVACRLAGAGLDRARQVLGAADGAPIRGAARHGTLDGHVLAAVCFWEDRMSLPISMPISTPGGGLGVF